MSGGRGEKTLQPGNTVTGLDDSCYQSTIPFVQSHLDSPSSTGKFQYPGHLVPGKVATMGKKIYVGNLSYDTTEAGLNDLFQAHGQVVSVKVITDRDSGRSKGFGFVEMGTEDEARSAIAALNGQSLDGRQLKVNESIDKPRQDNYRY